MRRFLYFVIAFGVTASVQGTLLQVTAPKRYRMTANNDVTVDCKVNPPRAVTNCQFSIPPHFENVGVHENNSLNINYTYTGAGFAKGDCKVVLKQAHFKVTSGTLIGCRARTAVDGWAYAYMSIDNGDVPDIILEEEHVREIILQEGGSKDIVFKTKSPITNCVFLFAGDTGAVLLNNRFDFTEKKSATNAANITFKYYGDGLHRGHCGITVQQNLLDTIGATAVWTNISTTSGSGEFFNHFVVQRTQQKPVLHVSPKYLQVGDKMRATCSVSESRLRATLTWTFGNDLVTSGVVDSINEEWTYPSTPITTQQTLTRRVDLADNGKTLKCESTSSEIEKEAQVEIRVHAKTSSAAARMTRETVYFLVLTTGVATVASCLKTYVN